MKDSGIDSIEGSLIGRGGHRQSSVASYLCLIWKADGDRLTFQDKTTMSIDYKHAFSHHERGSEDGPCGCAVGSRSQSTSSEEIRQTCCR